MAEELIAPDCIQVIERAENWQCALEQACQPLLEKKAITDQYVKKMKENVQKNGPYMVLKEGFALMHAAPGEGVITNAMSLLVSQQAIDFCGNAVQIILVLAAINHNDHLKKLQQVVMAFMNDEVFEQIRSGNWERITQIFKGE